MFPLEMHFIWSGHFDQKGFDEKDPAENRVANESDAQELDKFETDWAWKYF